eukprot:2053318-Rhodomonas_salina.1
MRCVRVGQAQQLKRDQIRKTQDEVLGMVQTRGQEALEAKRNQFRQVPSPYRRPMLAAYSVGVAVPSRVWERGPIGASASVDAHTFRVWMLTHGAGVCVQEMEELRH